METWALIMFMYYSNAGQLMEVQFKSEQACNTAKEKIIADAKTQGWPSNFIFLSCVQK